MMDAYMNNRFNEWFDALTALFGRVMVGGFFLWTGILNALSFADVSATMATLGLPYPIVIAAAVILVQVLSGVAIVTGAYVRPAALVLAVYLLIMTPVLHSALRDAREMAQFFQNFALMGALLYLSATERRMQV